MKTVHLVFPIEYIDGIKEELEEEGYSVKYKDTSLDTFSQWSQTDEENADVALVFGMAVISQENDFFSQQRAIYDRLKEVRLQREELRMIVVFPSQVQYERDFVSSIAQLAIFDLYFVDELETSHMIEWIENPKGYAHVDKVLQGYQPTEKGEKIEATTKIKIDESEVDLIEKETQIKNHVKEEPKKEKDDENVKRKEESKLRKQLASLKPLTQKEIRTHYRAFASKAIVVTSMKGGIGKTDVAINLAVAIKEHTNIKKIVVVDFDFPYGGIAAALKLQRTKSLGDWLLKDNEIVTEVAVKKKVVHHEGIDFIPMPLRLKDGLKFQELQAEIMIDILKRHYDIVIIDTSGFSKPAIVALERASEVILLTSHDVVSLSNAIAYKADLINMYGIDYEKISLFINQVPSYEDISKEKIAEIFEDHDEPVPVIGYAPFDDLVRQYRNKNLFIYKEKPYHSFSKGIDMILNAIEIITDEQLKRKNRNGVRENTQEKVAQLGLFFKQFKKTKEER